jgi:hypothetical protein
MVNVAMLSQPPLVGKVVIRLIRQVASRCDHRDHPPFLQREKEEENCGKSKSDRNGKPLNQKDTPGLYS